MSDLPINDLTERQARLFAADCAERALSRVESPDPRSVAAVKAARDFAEGRIGHNELDAAGAAAWAAEWDAAWDAAKDATGDAEWSAARSAAWSAESAADTAEWAAMWAAERAAEWSAEWSAAWDARAAEREWQAQRIAYYLNGEEA